MKLPTALQLYSVRTDMEQNYEKTLEQVAQLGFDGVEFAGFFNVPANQMKKTLDCLGLKTAGSHTSFELLKNNLEQVMTYNHILNNKNIICPYLAFPSFDSVLNARNELEEIGRKLQENDFQLFYHNHNHEFLQWNNTYILDLLLEEAHFTNPELDVYWTYRGGLDPVQVMKKYKDRLTLLHLKDGTLETDTSLFEGNVSLLPILDTALDIGIEWMIVEDETPFPASFSSVKRSMHSLKQFFS